MEGLLARVLTSLIAGSVGERPQAREATMRKGLVVGAMTLMTLWVASGAWAEKGDAVKGKEIFAKSCANCHGKMGKGDGPAAAALNPKPKDLSDKAYMAKLSDKYLSDIIAKGGAAVGKSPLMPPFGGRLKEQDIRNVTAYVRSLGR